MLSMKNMPYHIGMKVKIYPSNAQKRIIAVNDGAKRAVYNHLVACSNEKYQLKKTAAYVPVNRERMAYLDSVTKTAGDIMNALPYLYNKDVDAQTIANAIRNYKTAWKNMKEQHRGVPTFKHKDYTQSYQTNAHYYKDKKGNIISNVRFTGKHFVTLPKTGKVHGIDLNLTELVNGSDGEATENMRYYSNSMMKREKAQHKLNRRLERAKKEERKFDELKGYQRQRKKVAYLNRKTARQREDYLHRISKAEIENQDFIAAEDLKVSNLIRNHKLARAIADAGWRKLLTMLQYKGKLYGKTVVLVPPQYTTQTCSECGYKMKGEEKLKLADREWTCPHCGTNHKRDTNAAKNILKRGLEMVERVA